MNIRKAETRDIPRLGDLLLQVCRVHHRGRPDLFRAGGRKYTDEELAARRSKWVCPEPKIKTGYLARYARLVSSADKGAILG